MEKLELEDQGNPVPESTILMLESLVDIHLPKSYRNFLMTYNGGRPIKKDSFDFRDRTLDSKNNTSCISYFFGVLTGIRKKSEGFFYEDIVDEIKIYMWDERRIPWNLFPIADDPFGNLICIAVKGDDYGKIYFWDHELEADPDQGEDPSHYYDNISLIANSFDEFIEGLYEFKLPPE